MNYNKHILSWNKYYFKNKTKVDWGFDTPDAHIIDFEKFYSESYDFVNKKILDVGCGYGKNSKIFISKGYNYLGIDISKEPITYCRENIFNGNFALGNILTFNSEINFDLIVDAGCLHVNDKNISKIIIRKYFDLLEKNGILFLRIFKSNKEKQVDPLFIIDQLLPVWGYTDKEILDLVGKYFFVEKIILDSKFYDENEVFYLYLRKK